MNVFAPGKRPAALARFPSLTSHRPTMLIGPLERLPISLPPMPPTPIEAMFNRSLGGTLPIAAEHVAGNDLDAQGGGGGRFQKAAAFHGKAGPAGKAR